MKHTVKFALGAALLWFSAQVVTAQTNLYRLSFAGTCRTTNNLGGIVVLPISARSLLNEFAENHGITNTASLALVFDVDADEVEIVNAADGSPVLNALHFQDGVSVLNRAGTTRERQAFLYVDDETSASGSAAGAAFYRRDLAGNLAGFNFHGEFQLGRPTDATHRNRVYRGVFSTLAKFVPGKS